jgi:hypothetical protein
MADLNKMAYRVVQHATQGERERQEPSAAQESGRKGGLKGGKALAAKRTPKERSDAARKAAQARWAKK